MRLFFANKFFTFKGSSKVTDENKQLQFYIKGKFFTFTRKKYLQTPEGLPVFTIRNKYWHLFFHTALIFDNDNTLLMKIRGKFLHSIPSIILRNKNKNYFDIFSYNLEINLGPNVNALISGYHCIILSVIKEYFSPSFH